MFTPLESLYSVFLKHRTICTDSRKVTPGCLFFALRGDNFDGNAFALKALEDGAAFAVVSDENLRSEEDSRLLFVADTLIALQKLARHYRRHLTLPVLAITGSNGKTTTKELCAAVLSKQYKCHFTQGNFNNHIGLPLTLLSMPEDTEIVVVEMGANRPGDIAELCRIAEPSHGLVTNLGKAHLEGFGSFEGVKKTKAELYQFLHENGGLVFVNEDEKYLKNLTRSNRKRILYHSSPNPSLDTKPIEIKPLPSGEFVSFSFLDKTGEEITVNSQLSGAYNFNNLMTAVAIGRYFKVSPEKIKAALEEYSPTNNRSQLVHRGKRTFIMDAYNANPTSMANAVVALAHRQDSRPKIALLGDMLELGADSTTEHKKILRQATVFGFQHIVLVGPQFAQVKGRHHNHTFLPNSEMLREWVAKNLPEEAIILVKGSRGIRMERGVEEVVAEG